MYTVIVDYGSEGWSFSGMFFDDAAIALEYAMKNCSNNFLVVKIVKFTEAKDDDK